MKACPHPSGTMSRERRVCPRPFGTRNQASGTSSVRYEVVQRAGSSSSVLYDESSRQDFVRPLQSHVKEEHVHVRLVRDIKQVGLHQSSSNSHMESLSTFLQYEESSRRDFIRLVRCHVIGGHVLVGPVRRIKHARLHPSGTKSRERKACSRPSGMWNHAGWTSSIRYEIMRKEGLSSLV